ncbi:oxidoreductase [Loktanella salsilacus]|uniref:oxidoreductase n=1 Tax=Loktanella salsilacus TaxID=195913 RepID=UPI003734E7A4
MLKMVLTTATCVGFALAGATAALAQDMAAPQGDVLLTVTGDIEVTNVGETLQLDREQLAALDMSSFDTTTIWSDGVHTFAGTSLAAIVDFLNVTDGTILATAINDYTVEIPVSDAVEGGPIIATLMDGEEMSVRDKGPLWIVYPYDSRNDYRSEVVYSRSIWQLDRIEVKR